MLAVVELNSKIWWYTARASGIVAWVLVATTVVWGLAFAGRVTRRRPSPAWVLDLHRFLGGLTVVFVALHLGALVADSYAHFGWSELFVPMASAWQPAAVAWGIVAFYLLVAIEVTSLLMRHLPRRLWRAVHLTSFVLAFAGTIHGVLAGTDIGNPAVRKGLVVSAAVFVFTLVARVMLRRTGPRRGPVRARVDAERAASTV